MNKNTLKKLILAINGSSLENPTRHELILNVQRETQFSKRYIESTLRTLEKHNALEWIGDEVDLFPCAVIFARSKHNSIPEILSFWEMFKFEKELLSECDIKIKDRKIYAYIDRIKKEDPKKIISDTLSILYTDSIIHKDSSIPYKNQDHEMIDLECKDFLLKIMPKRGIPTNRDISKDLQVFFKDTLMHEFDRTCPICGIHMPHMLIASHIKPFRNCAHIYEAADHNNGLLLCRNHDFLFDQGYITFDNDGKLILSKELKHPEFFALNNIDPALMTKSRKLYMEYHRKTIFRDPL
ncbi:MAG TPA: HNH endonuclease [Candidatus Faecalicoccus intestinipullorum]|nr:HNH endonuclease [Candidatus Faecalicoccus intestinipullorum]